MITRREDDANDGHTNYNVEEALGRKFTILGPPVAWKRAGLNKKSSTFYDTQKTEKIAAGLQLKVQMAGLEPYANKPIKVMFIFFMPISKAAAKRGVKPGQYHFSDPDTSNLVKFYEDAMVDCGLLDNDNILAHETSAKIYSDDPGVAIYIREL